MAGDLADTILDGSANRDSVMPGEGVRGSTRGKRCPSRKTALTAIPGVRGRLAGVRGRRSPRSARTLPLQGYEHPRFRACRQALDILALGDRPRYWVAMRAIDAGRPSGGPVWRFLPSARHPPNRDILRCPRRTAERQSGHSTCPATGHSICFQHGLRGPSSGAVPFR